MTGRLHRDQSGMTVIELLVATIVAGLVLALVFGFFSSSLQTLTGAQVRSEMERDVQLASRRMQEDIELAAKTLLHNTITDPNAPGGTWTAQTTSPAVMIMESLALDSSRNIIFDPLTLLSYKNEVVYYVSGGTLYRRMLANTSAPGNSAVTSCPPALAAPACPADDAMLRDVTGFTLQHFTINDGAPAAYDDVLSTAAVFTVQRRSFGQNISLTREMRGVQRNIQ
jgi:type II secretory pathway pseudopilin PulG